MLYLDPKKTFGFEVQESSWEPSPWSGCYTGCPTPGSRPADLGALSSRKQENRSWPWDKLAAKSPLDPLPMAQYFRGFYLSSDVPRTQVPFLSSLDVSSGLAAYLGTALHLSLFLDRWPCHLQDWE